VLAFSVDPDFETCHSSYTQPSGWTIDMWPSPPPAATAVAGTRIWRPVSAYEPAWMVISGSLAVA